VAIVLTSALVAAIAAVSIGFDDSTAAETLSEGDN
jgi:hypothetical protein